MLRTSVKITHRVKLSRRSIVSELDCLRLIVARSIFHVKLPEHRNVYRVFVFDLPCNKMFDIFCKQTNSVDFTTRKSVGFIIKCPGQIIFNYITGFTFH